MPSTRAALGTAAAIALTACSYVTDRALDALDPYRAAVGVGTVLGVRGAAFGLVDTGLLAGLKPNATTLGWRYGAARFPLSRDPTFDADQAEILHSTMLVSFDYAAGGYRAARNSFALFPALLSWVDATPDDYEWHVPESGDDWHDRVWIWSAEASRRARHAQVHAFDVEFGVALFAFLDWGISPGEVADFLLGFLTIDIAGDDGRL